MGDSHLKMLLVVSCNSKNSRTGAKSLESQQQTIQKRNFLKRERLFDCPQRISQFWVYLAGLTFFFEKHLCNPVQHTRKYTFKGHQKFTKIWSNGKRHIAHNWHWGPFEFWWRRGWFGTATNVIFVVLSCSRNFFSREVCVHDMFSSWTCFYGVNFFDTSMLVEYYFS